MKVEVTGETLVAALENGVSRIGDEEEGGRYPQVSGIEFTYDPSRKPGSRVLSVTVKGEPLDRSKTYTLAVNTFLINGGDGYEMFKDARYIIKPEEGQVEPAVVMNAIAEAKTIAPKTYGRIKRIDRPAGRS